jgi:hypothetical protein
MWTWSYTIFWKSDPRTGTLLPCRNLLRLDGEERRERCSGTGGAIDTQSTGSCGTAHLRPTSGTSSGTSGATAGGRYRPVNTNGCTGSTVENASDGDGGGVDGPRAMLDVAPSLKLLVGELLERIKQCFALLSIGLYASVFLALASRRLGPMEHSNHCSHQSPPDHPSLAGVRVPTALGARFKSTACSAVVRTEVS